MLRSIKRTLLSSTLRMTIMGETEEFVKAFYVSANTVFVRLRVQPRMRIQWLLI